MSSLSAISASVKRIPEVLTSTPRVGVERGPGSPGPCSSHVGDQEERDHQALCRVWPEWFLGEGWREWIRPRRLRTAWAGIVAGYRWDYFDTLTLDPERDVGSMASWRRADCVPETLVKAVRQYVRECCRLSAVMQGHAWEDWREGYRKVADVVGGRIVRGFVRRRWCVTRGAWANSDKHGRSRVVWVLGVERHESGMLHCHVLIRLLLGVLKRLEFKAMREAWSEYGFNRPVSAKSSEAVSGYVSKYVRKGDLYLAPNFDPRADRLAEAERSALIRSVETGQAVAEVYSGLGTGAGG